DLAVGPVGGGGRLPGQPRTLFRSLAMRALTSLVTSPAGRGWSARNRSVPLPLMSYSSSSALRFPLVSVARTPYRLQCAVAPARPAPRRRPRPGDPVPPRPLAPGGRRGSVRVRRAARAGLRVLAPPTPRGQRPHRADDDPRRDRAVRDAHPRAAHLTQASRVR